MSYKKQSRVHDEHMARVSAALHGDDQHAAVVAELRAELTAAMLRAEAAEAARITLYDQRDGWMKRTWDLEAKLDAVRWFPVTDCMPAPELRVLATYNDGRMTIVLRALYVLPRTVLCDSDYEDSEYDEATAASYYPGGWYEAHEEGEYAFAGPLSGAVTHWTRLPRLPEVQP